MSRALSPRLPWLAIGLGLAALTIVGVGLAAGLPALGLDLGARLLFLALTPLMLQPWLQRRQNR